VPQDASLVDNGSDGRLATNSNILHFDVGGKSSIGLRSAIYSSR
jgi:hypothetical protein